MEVVEDRRLSGSTAITSQLSVDTSRDVIDEPIFADAILDRLIQSAHRLPIERPSVKTTRKTK
ncbi:MAG: ATP-binding protein [Pseudomonadota bacterium]